MKKKLPLPFLFFPTYIFPQSLGCLFFVLKVDIKTLQHFQIVLIHTRFNMFFLYVGIFTMCFFLWEQLTNSFICWRSNMILKQTIQCTIRNYSRSGLPFILWTIVGTWIVPRTTLCHMGFFFEIGIMNLDSKKSFWILPMHMLNGGKKKGRIGLKGCNNQR